MLYTYICSELVRYQSLEAALKILFFYTLATCWFVCPSLQWWDHLFGAMHALIVHWQQEFPGKVILLMGDASAS